MGMALAMSSHGVFSASLLGIEPPADLIVQAGGLEWVWAAPCMPNSPGCTALPDNFVVLSNRFELPTSEQWNASFAGIDALMGAFKTSSITIRCSAAYFFSYNDICNQEDAESGYIWNSPLAPDDTYRFNEASETFLVRTPVPEVGTFTLMMFGLGLVAGMYRRRA
jgi:hypothetical protein